MHCPRYVKLSLSSCSNNRSKMKRRKWITGSRRRRGSSHRRGSSSSNKPSKSKKSFQRKGGSQYV